MKMKPILISAALIIAIGGGILLYKITGTDESAVYHKISPQEAKSVMDSGKSYILLDVRTEAEFAAKHIDGTILIPDYEITSRAVSMLPDKNALILVYCQSGGRSAAAAKELVRMGYANVYDFGGIIGWPYETVNQ